MRVESLRREERKEIKTQRNLELGSTMKPTKSRETRACRRWVSDEMEDWAEVWIDDFGLRSTWDFDEVGLRWAGDVKAGSTETER